MLSQGGITLWITAEVITMSQCPWWLSSHFLPKDDCAHWSARVRGWSVCFDILTYMASSFKLAVYCLIMCALMTSNIGRLLSPDLRRRPSWELVQQLFWLTLLTLAPCCKGVCIYQCTHHTALGWMSFCSVLEIPSLGSLKPFEFSQGVCAPSP